MKVYAVKKGRKTGIFNSWDEAKAQVNGYSGAQYKSFASLKEAQEYLGEAKKAATLKDAIAQVANYQVKSTKKTKKTHQTKKVTEYDLNSYDVVTYTDGGSRNSGASHKNGKVKKTDKAAWAYRIEYGQKEVHQAGGEYGATNNKMELTALINAFERILEMGLDDQKLIFCLDSKYVLDGINLGWIYGWAKRGWKKANGPLSNKEQWQRIYQLLPNFKEADFAWVHGHNGDFGNEFVDHLLNKYMDEKM